MSGSFAREELQRVLPGCFIRSNDGIAILKKVVRQETGAEGVTLPPGNKNLPRAWPAMAPLVQATDQRAIPR